MGFAVLPARPYKARDKGSGECHIGVIQRGFFQEVRNRVRIPLKSPPIPKQTGTHCGANRQSEKSERSDAGILFIA